MTISSIRFLQDIAHLAAPVLILEFCPQNSRFYFRIIATLRSTVADDDISQEIARRHIRIIPA